MNKVIEVDGKKIDLTSVAINAVIIGFSTFIFTLAGMSLAQIEQSPAAAAYAGGMSALLKVSSFVVRRFGLEDGGT